MSTFQPTKEALDEVQLWNFDNKKRVLPLVNPNAKYAVIIVMAGDDEELGPHVVPDIREMFRGIMGGNEISVLLLTDKLGENRTVIQEVTLKGLAQMFECPSIDTGDPRPIAEFLTAGLCSYSPGTRIAIGFWGHASGIFGDLDPQENLLPGNLLELPLGAQISEEMFLKSYKPRPIPIKALVSRGMLPDVSSGTVLTNRELNSALAAAFSRSGRTEPVDMIFFDTCLNGSVEVYAELNRYCKTFVASALSIPGTGWNYTWFLQSTRRNQPKTARDWASIAVLAFDRTYDQKLYPIAAQLMALESTDEFIHKIREISTTIGEDQKNLLELAQAITLSQSVGHDESLDMFQLFAALREVTDNQSLKDACTAFMESYRKALITMSKPPLTETKSLGLTIWVPRLGDVAGVHKYYDSLNFHKKTSWLDTVKRLIQEEKKEPPKALNVLCLTGLGFKGDVDEQILKANEEHYFHLRIPELTKEWASGLEEGFYTYTNATCLTFGAPEHMKNFYEILRSIRRKESEFSPLSLAHERSTVLGAATCHELGHSFQKYEMIILDEFPQLVEIYIHFKELLARTAKSGAIVFV